MKVTEEGDKIHKYFQYPVSLFNFIFPQGKDFL